MPYLGEEIPKLGFGLMRLPMKDKAVDLPQVCQMVDRFLERGFTYFDTAYGYLDGASEAAAKAALVDRYPRERFQLATKLPAWAGAKSREEAEGMFWTSLERTGAGYFDFYLLHNVGEERTDYFDRYDIWNFLQARKAEGLIRHLGFSFHDGAAVLDRVLTEHPEMEFVQLQINYADWEDSIIQARACYETAQRHGKPVVIMEPVKGGSLAALPDDLEARLREKDPGASMPAWALRFAASLPGLVTVLSGMSNLEQMEENLETMSRFQPLDASEQALVEDVGRLLQNRPHIACTSCRYCTKGCPQGIPIPNIFKAMNIYLMHENLGAAKGSYRFGTRDGGFASTCIQCGQCESVCPQHLQIVQQLQAAAALLEAN